jgi:hypothetical protein
MVLRRVESADGVPRMRAGFRPYTVELTVSHPSALGVPLGRLS